MSGSASHHKELELEQALQDNISQTFQMSTFKEGQKFGFPSQLFMKKKKEFKYAKPKKNSNEQYDEKIFYRNIKCESVELMKLRESKSKALFFEKGFYDDQQKNLLYRSDKPIENKPIFLTRFKDSIFETKTKFQDLRPKETLEREERERLKKGKTIQDELDKFNQKVSTKFPFLTHFNLPKNQENMGDSKMPEYLDKDIYMDATQKFNSILRGGLSTDGEVKVFKMNFRALTPADKFLLLGDDPMMTYKERLELAKSRALFNAY